MLLDRRVAMGTSPVLQRLQRIARDFVCGDWDSPEVLTPEQHLAKAQAELAGQPGPITEARLTQARGT